MTDDDLIHNLQRAHTFKTYGGNGHTLDGTAASRLRELLVQKEQLEERITELLSIKHYLNEQLLEARAELNLKEALLRERS